MKKTVFISFLLFLTASTMFALADPPPGRGGGKHNPPPPPPPPVPTSVVFNVLTPALPDDSPLMTPIANVIINMSDGTTNFTGTLGFGSPNSDGTWPSGFAGPSSCMAIMNRTVVLACQLPAVTQSEVLSATITATQ